MDAKFQFYEIVRVAVAPENHAHVYDMEGAILGRAQDDNGAWTYAVHLYDLGSVWNFKEEMLQPTGRMDKRETFYSGEHIKVIVDPETHEGKIAEEDDSAWPQNPDPEDNE